MRVKCYRDGELPGGRKGKTPAVRLPHPAVGREPFSFVIQIGDRCLRFLFFVWKDKAMHPVIICLRKGDFFMTEQQPTTRNKRGDSSRLIRRITLTAVFTAFAVVLKCFTKVALTIPGIGVQISFGGIFTFFPAILFGPIYGGAASALTDFLGAMIAPTGAYIPWLTVTAFLGGFLKGLVWKWMKNGLPKPARATLAGCVAVVGVLGLVIHLSLSGDGLAKGFFIKQADLPTKPEVVQMQESGELSALSNATVKLAQYNKDTFTLTKVQPAEDQERVTLPSTITFGGVSYSLTKLNSGVLADCLDKTVVIPASYKTIADDAFGDVGDRTARIMGESGSAAEKFAGKMGWTFVEWDAESEAAAAGGEIAADESGYTVETAEGGELSIRSSDSYRKYLASYLNLASAGLMLFGILGLAFFGVSLIVARVRKSHPRLTDAENVSYLKILLTILIPGLVVTTINTYVLSLFVASYAGRALIILWVPRVCEELVVNIMQAYLISLLYGVVARGRLKRMMEKL